MVDNAIMANNAAVVNDNTILLENAYQQCEQLAKTHYENFPVASLLLPTKLRRPIAVIYAFARLADDIADEGTLSQEDRLQQLDLFWQNLEHIEKNHSIENSTLFLALNDVLKKHPQLPITLFFDLLRAFKQDVVKSDYANFEEILNYCQYSANPIGRLLLYLTNPNKIKEKDLLDSDAICTALQLINFLQDLQDDLTIRHRCYLPQDEMEQLNIQKEQLLEEQLLEEQLQTKENTPAIRALILQQIIKAEALLKQGSPLGKRLTGRFGFELRLIINCGFYMIGRLKKRKGVYARPTIRLIDWPLLILKALVV